MSPILFAENLSYYVKNYLIWLKKTIFHMIGWANILYSYYQLSLSPWFSAAITTVSTPITTAFITASIRITPFLPYI